MKTCLVLILTALCVALAAAKGCQKEAEKAGKGKPVPECNGDDFAPVQCSDNCFCADANSGKNKYMVGGFTFPKAGDYDCSKKPTACQIERFANLASGQEPPVCDENGDYPVQKKCSYEAGTTNLARNMFTMQSSVGWDGVSSRAVDGNKDPTYDGRSCTHTQSEFGAWWAVDLAVVTQVSKVALTKRVDSCCDHRLDHVQMGMTNSNPRVTSPSAVTYTACAAEPRVFGNAATRSFTCDAKGRYLVVQLQNKDYLTLCEVEVFGVVERCE
jgi:hypothetical protein